MIVLCLVLCCITSTEFMVQPLYYLEKPLLSSNYLGFATSPSEAASAGAPKNISLLKEEGQKEIPVKIILDSSSVEHVGSGAETVPK